MDDRKVILFIACSLDGYIATKDGGLDFLSIVETPGEDYGYSEFINRIDTVIMGRKTFDKVKSIEIEFPHKDKNCFVLSRSKSGMDASVHYYNGPISELISQIRETSGKDIFLDGGSEVISGFMRYNLIDLFIISIIPCLLGDGIPLFTKGDYFRKLKLVKQLSFPSGLLQLWYENS